MKAKWILLAAAIGIALLASGCTLYAFSNHAAPSPASKYEATRVVDTSGLEYEPNSQISSSIKDSELGDSTEKKPHEIPEDIDGNTEYLFFDSVDEASSHVPFPIALPNVLPESAEQVSVAVFPGHPITKYAVSGISIDYRLSVDDKSFLSQFGDAHIMLVQSDLLSYMPMYFEEQYNSAPSVTYVEGVVHETAQIGVNHLKAVIGAYNLQVFFGLESPPNDYLINAVISWCKDGVYYQLSVFAPYGAVTYEELIAIAESIG